MPSSPESEPPERGAAEGAAPENPTGGTAAPAQDELSELRERYSELEDRYLRAKADVDNVRKRAARDAIQRAVEAREAAVREWLEVIDSAERALHHGAEDLRPLLEQMENVLGRQGVSRVGREGELFDPERHEAISVRDTDEVPDRTIVDVARSGYEASGHVLRPAQVVVARAPSDGNAAEATETPG